MGGSEGGLGGGKGEEGTSNAVQLVMLSSQGEDGGDGIEGGAGGGYGGDVGGEEILPTISGPGTSEAAVTVSVIGKVTLSWTPATRTKVITCATRGGREGGRVRTETEAPTPGAGLALILTGPPARDRARIAVHFGSF